MPRHLSIILRTCGRVEGLNTRKRYIQKPKIEIIRTCVSSLIQSINNVNDHSIELTVLDDHSSPQCVEMIQRIIEHCKFPYRFLPITDGTGINHMLMHSNNIAAEAEDLFYHVEDDYIHFPNAIQDMLDSVETFEAHTEKMVAINPHDDIWRYTRNVYPSYILLGPYRHYRTCHHTTYTFLASAGIYKKYKQHFDDAVTMMGKIDWAEDKSINQVWNKEDVLVFSPIPSLALHIMEVSGKDPFINTEELWDSIPDLTKNYEQPNIAIVCLYNEKHKDLAAITWKNKEEYAEKHGYYCYAKTDNFSKEQVHFDKFIHILDVFDKHPETEWAWWLDNDALITNFDIKVETLIDNNYHIIMPVDLASLNTGSFLVRNSLQSREWLQYMIENKWVYKNDTRWFEQQAVVDFYPKFQNIFKVIPQRLINSYDYSIYGRDSVDLLGYDGQWQQEHFVLHWPGLPNETRIKLAETYKKYIKDTR